MNDRTIASLAFLCFGLAFASTASADGGPSSTMKSNYVLFAGQGLVSDSCYYHLDMQYDGNLVLYAGAGNDASQAIWADNEAGNNGGNAYAILQADGNFVEYVDLGTQVGTWNAGTNHGQSVLWLQNDGHVVIYPATSPGSNDWWASNQAHGNVPGPIPCNMDSHATEVEYGTGLSGPTFEKACYAPFPAVTTPWQTCGDLCARTAGCNGWSYYESSSCGNYTNGAIECDLKGAAGSTFSNPDITSGIVRSYSGVGGE
jgi:hypothetical protein